MKYAIIGVEGQHDQAFVGKILKSLGFKDFRGLDSELDIFWRKFIPIYPKKGKLYERLPMPSILFSDAISVAVYVGEGSNLVTNLSDILYVNSEYQTNIAAFGIVADADRNLPDSIVANYSKCFRDYFENFPEIAGIVDINSPRTGIFVLPDNISKGVLETLLCSLGDVVYPEYMERSRSYLAQFSDEERKSLKWKPFDSDKALIATVVSVLKPGKTNTVSIADNKWVSEQTQKEVAALGNFIDFLKQLLELS